MKHKARLTRLILSCCIFLLIPNKNSAADVFDLSYSLTEGGYQLEIDSANPHKGVRIEVSSDIATQYEITSSIIKPLEKRDSPDKTIKDNFVVRALTGTNLYGNLRVPASDSPVRTSEIIYVSSSAGNADNFTLIYSIVNEEEILPGYYAGKLAFTLRPIGSSQQPVTKILDVYVNIKEGLDIAGIQILPVNSLRDIRLNSQKEGMQSADVVVNISGGFRNQFALKQVMTRPLESNEGNQLGINKLSFLVKEATQGSAVNQETALSSQPQVVYTSGANGEHDNSFIITYTLADITSEQAGKYSSLIQYILDDSKSGQKRPGNLNLEVEIERIFDFNITPEDKMGSISFANLNPKEPPRRKEVVIEISSNIKKQYQLSQNVYSGLTNKDGAAIPSKYFTLKTEAIETKGALKFPEPQEVKKGETALFISDRQGSSDKFKVIYELTCPLDVASGDYSTRIVYSLSEL